MYGLGDRDESDRDQKGKGNLWATIGGIIKYFRFSREEILWGYSWANLIMLMASIPSYKKDEVEDKVKSEGREITDENEFMGLMR